MGTPAGLYYLFGVLMLAVAGYGIVLLVLSLAAHRPLGRDVDISHTFMGIAMAGMFVPAWTFGPNGMWELIFGALMVWFIANSVLSVQMFGPHVPHALVHAVMSFAMIIMYRYPFGSTRGSDSMSMSGTPSGAHLDGGIGLLLEFVLLGSAIFTLASPNKGASHHGSHIPTRVMSGAAGPVAEVVPHGGPGLGVLSEIEARVAIPWLEDLTHVVMCIAMAFMLILMV
jgi:hypothetical protein